VYTAPLFVVESDRFRYRIADPTGWQATGYVVIRVAPSAMAGTTCDIDFTPMARGRTATAEGAVLRDTGAAFSRQNSLEYGWDRERQRGTPPIFGQDDKWQIALPNGKYFVFIQSGGLFGDEAAEIFDRHSYKTSNFSQGTGKIPYHNDLLVEGVRFRDSDDTFEEFDSVYDYVSHEVTVSAGRLTIKAGPDAQKARIKRLVIAQIK
jgi:hypothetical protein